MIGPATHIVTILRGTTQDEYLDTVDVDAVYKTGVQMTIYEDGANTSKPADNRSGTVRTYTGRARAHEGVRVNDRLRDEASGDVYVVESASTLPNPVSSVFTRLKLKRDTTG